MFCWWRTTDTLLGGLALGLLGQEDSLDVGEHTTLCDGHAGEQFVQLLVVADGQLEMTGNDLGLLVVAGGVSCQLENLSGQVLHDGGQVHGGSGTVTLEKMTVDTSGGELKSSPGATGLALSLRLSSLTTSRHDDSCVLQTAVITTMKPLCQKRLFK